MEIPIAVPVGETTGYKNAEEYTLEQKQQALTYAEQELKNAIDMSGDFFDTEEDMTATIHDILQHPDAVYTKPFMKKIANAVLRVAACKQELDWASESVVDTSLTPSQVKAQVKQLLEVQRITLEQKMNADRAEWRKQLHDLQEELKEERQHRKAFQAKVKDFSEDVYVLFLKEHSAKYATNPSGGLSGFLIGHLSRSVFDVCGIDPVCIDSSCGHTTCNSKSLVSSCSLFDKYKIKEGRGPQRRVLTKFGDEK
jgi:hypothetical protein